MRQQASRGQELEFEAFARARLPELLRLGVLLSGDSQQSQDLTQTALTKAFLHWRAVSPPTTRTPICPRSWSTLGVPGAADPVSAGNDR